MNIDEGMLPDRLLLLKSKTLILVRLPIESGMEPVKAPYGTCSLVKAVKLPIDKGKGPARLLELNKICCTSPLLTTMPNQLSNSVCGTHCIVENSSAVGQPVLSVQLSPSVPR